MIFTAVPLHCFSYSGTNIRDSKPYDYNTFRSTQNNPEHSTAYSSENYDFSRSGYPNYGSSSRTGSGGFGSQMSERSSSGTGLYTAGGNIGSVNRGSINKFGDTTGSGHNSRYSEVSTRISEDPDGRYSSKSRNTAPNTYHYDAQNGRDFGGSNDRFGKTGDHSYGSPSSSNRAPQRERPLTLLGVAVPVYKFRGEDAQLECQYDRGTDPLYSVKWYKDDDEFFR